MMSNSSSKRIVREDLRTEAESRSITIDMKGERKLTKRGRAE